MIAPVATQAAAILPTVPLIVGDGVHPDGAGLNALLRGEVVEFADARMAEGVGWITPHDFRMPAGRFLMEEPMYVKGTENITRIDGSGSHFILDNDDTCLRVEGGDFHINTLYGSSRQPPRLLFEGEGE
jgi:hypothetical protein